MDVESQNMQTILKIDGMSCQNCVRHATEALAALEGVVAATVTLEPGQGIIEHSDSVKLESMISALEEEGYTAEPNG